MAQERAEHDYDQAVAGRLARLGQLPVDTTRLDRRLAKLIPNPIHRRFGRWEWFISLRTAAAFLIAFGIVAAVIISLAGRPVLASPDQLAEIHQNVMRHDHGHSDVHRVASMEEAGQVLSSRWNRMPELPAMPEGHVMACCLHTIGRKTVGAVALEAGGVPVTLAIANAGDARLPDTAPIMVGENRYWVQSSHDVNMVLMQRNGRWMCLMGETKVERLIEIAEGLMF
jgi:hypothetical protein